ncbi:alpha/beta hydrolase family protein [Falsibacillus albus]|uniref:Dipeptidyl aminopeptidase n=1 Tax=Falsibacillus albus TaxID=2478915 RepID=A0A3L7K2E6_9BACI|nr:dienelactone hydrolase family protein [Falsibacillus albus]RLQ94862.1 dipeptidyl aminopeptidase [Falsibacillus albus]
MYSLMELSLKGVPSLLENIETIKDWKSKRESILNAWIDCIGKIPPLIKTRMDIISWEDHDDHLLVKIRYLSVFGDWVPASLLIPNAGKGNKLIAQEDVRKRLSHNGSSLPAILALHPTSESGKDDICLDTGRENRQYGLELVKRGYLVLAPDTITAGERVLPHDQPFHTASFYRQHPDWSAVGKMISDHRQGISLLESLSIVDAEKIGVIGHSLGGYNGYFLAGVDKRVKAVVCSCGFTTLSQDPEIHRWGRRDWFTHIPKLSDYINEARVPFEFNEIAALAAPVPLFMWMGQNDKIFPHWKPAADGLADLHSLYAWMGEEEKYTSLIGSAGHDFPLEIRGIAYSFLDRWLYAGKP